MFTVSAETFPDSKIEYLNSKRGIIVHGVGHFILQDSAPIVIDRPNGRQNYLFIYIHAGKGRFLLDGKQRDITAGNAVLFRPEEAQFYSYDAADTPDVYWAHFSGIRAPDILESLNMSWGNVFHIQVQEAYTKIFDELIRELQLKRPFYEHTCDALFRVLMATVGRITAEQSDTSIPKTAEIEEAVRLFQTQFSEPFHLSEYAAAHNMSPCWFTRLFTRQMGVSPQQYLTTMRINRACELLMSGASVTDAGVSVGYQDSQYFSRIFKKHTGFAPSQYRKVIEDMM